MAPLARGWEVTRELYHLAFHRAVQNTTASDQAGVVTPGEAYTLQCLALAFSSISVTSAILAFYWFCRMRRSFRHDLIMLLIQSDMFKALWYMAYPIVAFINGPVPNDSTFCQVNGFFLSLGIEASDFAILMIAVHSALFIFRAKTSEAEGGLYPYRYVAYALWVIFPVLMAALAFVNDSYAYVTDGTYCYLPIRPFWYRLTLSWIPRYVIFVVIVGIYFSIYCYVRYKFHGFSKEGTGSEPESNDSCQDTQGRGSVPPTPTLVSHGLLPESSHSSYHQHAFLENPARRKSVTSPNTEAHRFMWTSFLSRDDSNTDTLTPPPSPPSASSTVDIHSPPTSPQSPPPVHCNQSISFSHQNPRPPHPFSWRDGVIKNTSDTEESSNKKSLTNMRSVLRHKPGSTQSTTPIAQLHLVNSHGQNLATSEMMRARTKIARQLRFLFIYPLAYMGMWILPFIAHILEWNDRYALNPPFLLTCLTTVFVCSQAAVDCWLFSTREKPWRHIPGNDADKSFLGSFKYWSIRAENRPSRRERRHHGPGKTRQEMAREAKHAYRRRDQESQEISQRRTDSLNFEAPRRERSWWDGGVSDARGGDLGAMSPVAEEVRNPLEMLGPGGSSEGQQDVNMKESFDTEDYQNMKYWR